MLDGGGRGPVVLVSSCAASNGDALLRCRPWRVDGIERALMSLAAPSSLRRCSGKSSQRVRVMSGTGFVDAENLTSRELTLCRKRTSIWRASQTCTTEWQRSKGQVWYSVKRLCAERFQTW